MNHHMDPMAMGPPFPLDMTILDQMMMHQQHIPNPMVPLPETGFSLPDSETTRKKRGTNSTVKRRPYTRLACFNCKEKHQKCDGQAPCSNCSNKGLDCKYREERNRRRDVDGDIREEIIELQTKVEHWKNKYLALKKFVDDSLIGNTGFPPVASVVGPPYPQNLQPLPKMDGMNGSLFQPYLPLLMHDPNNQMLLNHPYQGILDSPQLVGILPQGQEQIWNPTTDVK